MLLQIHIQLDKDIPFPLPNNTSLMAPKPMLVPGLLRVGGRLSHAELEPDVKHPLNPIW